MSSRDIIVIGASCGGVEALSKIVSYFQKDFKAKIFIVQHIPKGLSVLDQILSGKGALQALHPEDGETMRPGVIYIAPPNRHLLINENHLRVIHGPRENRMRPSIDVLFRSAAGYCTTRVIAVLLTGYLDDGVSGLAAVKRCGGIAIVQDPAEAEAPEMPQTAISKVKIDHVLPLEGIAKKIIALSGESAGAPSDVPEDIMTDIRNSEYNIPDLDEMEKLGRRTPFTCPECGGVMWKRDNEPIARYVCHTGHSFTEKSLLEGQSKVIEYSLWKAIRHLEERVKILRTMAEGDREKGKSESAKGFGIKADDLKYHADIIRDFIMSGKLTSLGEGKVAESVR